MLKVYADALAQDNWPIGNDAVEDQFPLTSKKVEDRKAAEHTISTMQPNTISSPDPAEEVRIPAASQSQDNVPPAPAPASSQQRLQFAQRSGFTSGRKGTQTMQCVPSTTTMSRSRARKRQRSPDSTSDLRRTYDTRSRRRLDEQR